MRSATIWLSIALFIGCGCRRQTIFKGYSFLYEEPAYTPDGSDTVFLANSHGKNFLLDVSFDPKSQSFSEARTILTSDDPTIYRHYNFSGMPSFSTDGSRLFLTIIASAEEHHRQALLQLVRDIKTGHFERRPSLVFKDGDPIPSISDRFRFDGFYYPSFFSQRNELCFITNFHPSDMKAVSYEPLLMRWNAETRRFEGTTRLFNGVTMNQLKYGLFPIMYTSQSGEDYFIPVGRFGQMQLFAGKRGPKTGKIDWYFPGGDHLPSQPPQGWAISRRGRGSWGTKAKLSPDGNQYLTVVGSDPDVDQDKSIIISNRDPSLGLFVGETTLLADGDPIKSIGKHCQIYPPINFSPDGKSLIFEVKVKGKHQIISVDRDPKSGQLSSGHMLFMDGDLIPGLPNQRWNLYFPTLMQLRGPYLSPSGKAMFVRTMSVDGHVQVIAMTQDPQTNNWANAKVVIH